ncbi:50S ribosomal protein L35ae [Candidatus Woesearchaeota archaeon CG10_big_fil_rev_8_21_14_0_10_37_12]|nr:MAG: 50S ribosomal protein L35ae [Candidatus Woesearchaeota archaeon CG10_big_fil_rev_8_21_14_0_10_37_12]
MAGVIVHFRGSQKRKKGNQVIVVVPGVDTNEKAKAYVGKKVSWTAPGKNKTTISGKVSAPHGNKGALRVLFERGMPGQSLGEEVKIE